MTGEEGEGAGRVGLDARRVRRWLGRGLRRLGRWRARRWHARQPNRVARVGGDEFTLVFTGLTNRDRLADIARRLIARIEEPVTFDGALVQVSASIGICLRLPGDPASPDDLRARADNALYASKHAGRAAFRFAAEDAETAPSPSPVRPSGDCAKI